MYVTSTADTYDNHLPFPSTSSSQTSKYFLTISIIETKINYSKSWGTLSTARGDNVNSAGQREMLLQSVSNVTFLFNLQSTSDKNKWSLLTYNQESLLNLLSNEVWQKTHNTGFSGDCVFGDRRMLQQHLTQVRRTTVSFQLHKSLKKINCSAGEAGDMGLIPGLGRSSGESNGNPPEYSCLGNLMDREAWWVEVHGVTESRTRRSNWAPRTYAQRYECI